MEPAQLARHPSSCTRRPSSHSRAKHSFHRELPSTIHHFAGSPASSRRSATQNVNSAQPHRNSRTSHSRLIPQAHPLTHASPLSIPERKRRQQRQQTSTPHLHRQRPPRRRAHAPRFRRRHQRTRPRRQHSFTSRGPDAPGCDYPVTPGTRRFDECEGFARKDADAFGYLLEFRDGAEGFVGS